MDEIGDYGRSPAMEALPELREEIEQDQADIRAGRWKELAARKARRVLRRLEGEQP